MTASLTPGRRIVGVMSTHDDTLHAYAASQFGLLTRADVFTRGGTDKYIRKRLERSELAVEIEFAAQLIDESLAARPAEMAELPDEAPDRRPVGDESRQVEEQQVLAGG